MNRLTVLVALAANLVIAAAQTVGGLISGSPALLSEAAHSVADSLNEIFLLAALRRSRLPADARHPFGYGKERCFWALLAAVGIFVMGGCFSFYQGLHALRRDDDESPTGHTAGLIVLGVALVAESTSPARALHQARGRTGAAIDLAPGIDSERVEEVSMRIRQAMGERWPQADQVFPDITNAPPSIGL
ncbi:cation diffusion facilitator family transporter [Streptomyces microflavus]|uniref:cation diffusion facilitator family transporter n=1 Tax=Streptomyces microflavus TaxID=1919 RepID=UPI0033E772A4